MIQHEPKQNSNETIRKKIDELFVGDLKEKKSLKAFLFSSLKKFDKESIFIANLDLRIFLNLFNPTFYFKTLKNSFWNENIEAIIKI